jgi:hypothetical protein
MYVTVRRSKLFGGTDEIVRRARDGLVPTLRRLPGFVSYDILSLEDNVVMGITIFDNEASAQEANKSFVLWARELDLRSLLTGPHEVLSGQALIHEVEHDEFFPESGGGYGM